MALKQCIGSLEKLAASESDDEEKAKLSALRDKLVFLDPSCLASAHKGEMSQFAASMRDLNDQLMPTRAHALVSLKHLINGRDEETMSNSQRLLDLLKVCLVDPESYIYLAAINTLAAMATVKPKRTIPFLTEAFLNDHRTVQERVNVGEVLIQLSKRLGEMAPYYSRDLMNCFFIGLKSNDPAIRISTLSNLGQLCSVLGFAMSSYINEALSAIKALLQTDECLEVRRASVMFLSLVVNGLDKDSLEVSCLCNGSAKSRMHRADQFNLVVGLSNHTDVSFVLSVCLCLCTHMYIAGHSRASIANLSNLEGNLFKFTGRCDATAFSSGLGTT